MIMIIKIITIISFKSRSCFEIIRNSAYQSEKKNLFSSRQLGFKHSSLKSLTDSDAKTAAYELIFGIKTHNSSDYRSNSFRTNI